MPVQRDLRQDSAGATTLDDVKLKRTRLTEAEVDECDKLFRWGRMKSIGFNPIDDPDLKLRSDEYETIYNRGSGEKSNFFVFTRKMRGRFRVFYSNPNPDINLKKDDILVVRDYDGSVPREEWVAQVLEEIEAASKMKDEKTLYLSTHSHLGRIVTPDESKGRHVLDEGSSTDKDMIRQMMLYHRDVDASVYHNYFDEGDYRLVAEKERIANIVKVPAVEITLPVEPNDMFGPHFLAFFNGTDAAMEVQQKMLYTKQMRHSRSVASAAIRTQWMKPSMTFKDTLEYFNSLRAQGKLALGMAHPAGDRYFGRSGLWNLVSRGKLSLKDLLRIGRDNVDVIEMFNTEDIGVRDTLIPFAPEVKRFIDSALGKCEVDGRKVGRQRLTRDTLCLLTPAIIMNGVHPAEDGTAVKGEKTVKSTSFGDDAHFVPKFKKKPRASLLGCGRSVIELGEGETVGNVTPEYVIEAIQSGRMHGEAFWDYGKMGPAIVKARSPGLSVREVAARVKHNTVGLTLAVLREGEYMWGQAVDSVKKQLFEWN
jgi:hypothetical protein